MKMKLPVQSLIAHGDEIIYEVFTIYMLKMLNQCDHSEINSPHLRNETAVYIAHYILAT